MDLEISGCNGKVDNGCNIGRAEVTSLKLHLRLGGMLLAILGATLFGTPTDTEWDIRASLGEQLLENTTWGQESEVNRYYDWYIRYENTTSASVRPS